MTSLLKLSGSDLMEEGQLQAEFVYNDFAVVVDALMGTPLIETWQTTDPPVSPSNGKVYLTATAGCILAWDGKEDNFAIYFNGWHFVPVFHTIVYDRAGNRTMAWNEDESGDGWYVLSSGPGGGGGAGVLAWENVKQQSPTPAVGNGITNDKTAVQDAIDTVQAAGGGIVYFPVGVYSCTSLTLDDNVTLLGDGLGVSVIQNRTAGDLVIASGKSQFAIKNLTLDGDGLTGDGFMASTSTDFLLDHVEVINSLGSGFNIVTSCSDFVLTNCRVDSCTNGFILQGASGACTHGRFVSCYTTGIDTAPFNLQDSEHLSLVSCHDAGSDPSTASFALRGVLWSAVTGCTVAEGSSLGTPSGFYATNGGTNGACQFLTFNGCRVENTTIYGFYISDTKDSSIIGCVASGCLQGLRLVSVSTPTDMVERISVNGCSFNSNERDGILIQGAQEVAIVGCTVMNNSQDGATIGDGIRIEDGADTGPTESENILIMGNRIGDDQGIQTQDYAVSMIDATDAVVLSGNDLRGGIQSTVVEIGTTGTDLRFDNNQGWSDEYIVASDTTLALPDVADGYKITGNTTINAISSVRQGKILALRFTDASINVVQGSIKLIGGDYSPSSTDDVLLLYDDGSNMREIARASTTTQNLELGVTDFMPDHSIAAPYEATTDRIGNTLGWLLPDVSDSVVIVSTTKPSFHTRDFTTARIRFASSTSADDNLQWIMNFSVLSFKAGDDPSVTDSDNVEVEMEYGNDATIVHDYAITLTNPVTFTTGDSLMVSLARDSSVTLDTASVVYIFSVSLEP
jgi:hypothetical protein